MEQTKSEKIDKFSLKFQSRMIQDEYFQFKTRNQLSIFSYISYGFIIIQVCISYMDIFTRSNHLQQQSFTQEGSILDGDGRNTLLIISIFVDTLLILIFCLSLYIASRFPKYIDQLLMISYISYQIQLSLLIIPHLKSKASQWWEDIPNTASAKDSRIVLIKRDIDIAFIIGSFSFMQQAMLLSTLKRWWLKEICVITLAVFSFISFGNQIGWFNLFCLGIILAILAAFLYFQEVSQMQRFFEYFIVNKKAHSFYKFVDSSIPHPICVFSIQFPADNGLNQNIQRQGDNFQSKSQESISSSVLYNSQLNENNFHSIQIPPIYSYTQNNLQIIDEQVGNTKQITNQGGINTNKKYNSESQNIGSKYINESSPSNIHIVKNQINLQPQNNFHQILFTKSQRVVNKHSIKFQQEFCNKRFQKDFLNIYNNDLDLIFEQFIIPSKNNINLGDVLRERYSPKNFSKIIEATLKNYDDSSSYYSSNQVVDDNIISQEIVFDCLYNAPLNSNNFIAQNEDIYQSDSIRKQVERRKYLQEQKYRVHILESYWEDSFSVVVTFQNISEKISNQELIKENQYKDQLLFTISHDLKTPLNGMQSILQAALLKDNVEQIKKMIQLVQINGDLLNYLIKDILDYAQVIHKKIKPRPTYFNLQNTLQNIKQTFLYQIQEKGLKFNIINNLSNSFLYTDEIRLKQIIFNFVSNALKFTFQGSITIKVQEANDCDEIEDELKNDHDCTQSLNIQLNNNLISMTNSARVQNMLIYSNSPKRINQQNLLLTNNTQNQNPEIIHKNDQLNQQNEMESNFDKDIIINDELHIQQSNQNLSHFLSPNFPSHSNFFQKDSKVIFTPQQNSFTVQTKVNASPLSQKEGRNDLLKYCTVNNKDHLRKVQINGLNNQQFKTIQFEQNNISSNQLNFIKDENLNQNQNPSHPIFDQSNQNQFQANQLRTKKNGVNKQISSQITQQVAQSLKSNRTLQLSQNNYTENLDQKIKMQQQLRIPQDMESQKSVAVKTYNYKLQQDNNQNDMIKITVIDTGLGIDANQQKQLFSMFGTFEQKGVNKEGVGLGLIIAQSLSQLLGPKTNNIKVVSSKNQGSQFSFKIYSRLQNGDTPINKIQSNRMIYHQKQPQNDNTQGQRQLVPSQDQLNQEENEEELTTAINQNDTQKICDYIQKLFIKPTKILIVDDVQFNISVFKCLLHTLTNITFSHAYNGQQAVDKVKSESFDIIFMDINMPVMDGIQATKVIRNLIEQKKIPNAIIIALTGDDIDTDSSKFSQIGFNAALSKPIKLEDLYITLKALHQQGEFE